MGKVAGLIAGANHGRDVIRSRHRHRRYVIVESARLIPGQKKSRGLIGWASQQRIHNARHLMCALLDVAARMFIQPARSTSTIDKHHLRRSAVTLDVSKVLADRKYFVA